MAAAREQVGALARQIALARQEVSASRDLLRRAAIAPCWPSYEAFLPQADTNEPAVETVSATPTFAAVTELIERVERSAVQETDLIGQLIANIRRAIQNEVDPSLLMGVLLEGIVQTVLERLSSIERRDTVVALCSLLVDRVNIRQIGLD